MSISTAPALPALLASGWEEHYNFMTRYQCSFPPGCSCSLCKSGTGGITPHLCICYCTLTNVLSHLPHVCNGSGTVLQRVGKLKVRDHLALAKLDVHSDVKLAILSRPVL